MTPLDPNSDDHLRILSDTSALGDAKGKLEVIGLPDTFVVEEDQTPTYAEQTTATAEMRMHADYPGTADDLVTKIRVSGKVVGQAESRLEFVSSKAPLLSIRPNSVVLRPGHVCNFKSEFRSQQASPVLWQVDSGHAEITGHYNEMLHYVAPETVGTYLIHARLASDPAVTAYATVVVEAGVLDATIATVSTAEADSIHSAEVRHYAHVTYVWVLDGGEITQGQGTNKIYYRVGDKVSCRLHCTITDSENVQAIGMAYVQVLYHGLVVETLAGITNALDPIAVDRDENVYFALAPKGELEQIVNGVVSPLVGDDVQGDIVDGSIYGSSSSIMVEPNGDIWVDGDLEYVVHRLTPEGILEPLYGEVTKSSIIDPSGSIPYLGTPVAGSCTDTIHFFYDTGLCGTVDETGEVFFVAGKENSFGFQDGQGDVARFSANPWGSIFSEDSTSVWFTDTENDAIRNITLAGAVTTLTGGSGYQDGLLSDSKFRRPAGICRGWIQDQIVIADTGNACIRSILNGAVETLCGDPNRRGFDDGPVHTATLTRPVGIAYSRGDCYFTDSGRIRRIITNMLALPPPAPAPIVTITTVPKAVLGQLHAAAVPVQPGTFHWQVEGANLEAGQGTHQISFRVTVPKESITLIATVTNVDGYSLTGQKVVPVQ